MSNPVDPARFAHIPEVHLGEGVEVHPSAQIGDLRRLDLGDHTYVGPGVRVFGQGELVVGDYGKIHNNTTICAKNSVRLGHVAWVGQESYLDGTDALEAGDFVCLGIHSQCFTHSRGGDELQGCIFEGDRRLQIGDDVWLMTGCMVSPCQIGARTVALMGSVLTRSVGANLIVGGNPAEDLTHKFRSTPYVDPGVDLKCERMAVVLQDFFSRVRPGADRDRVRVVREFPASLESRVTYYNVADRTYTKTLHPEEVALNHWLFGYKAKFRPRDNDEHFKSD